MVSRKIEIVVPDFVGATLDAINDVKARIADVAMTSANGSVFNSQELSENLLLGMLMVLLLVLLVSLARVILARISITRMMPESCIIVLLGCILGFCLLVGDTSPLQFDTEVFFLILVPPIIWEAGFRMDKSHFFNNIGLISLYSVVGTILSTVITGVLIYVLRGLFVGTMPEVPIFECLAFGALINAIDSVSVMSIFDEVRVNETLNILLFGEGVLNNAVAIVIYNVFFNMANDGSDLDGKSIIFAIITFVVTTLAGAGIGVVSALVCAGITRFASGHLNVLCPLFLFIFAFLSYLTAEVARVSGIVAILACGIVQEQYCEANLSRAVRTSLHVLMKLVASTAEAVIFVYLGITTTLLFTGFARSADGAELVFYFDWGLTIATIVIVTVLRFVITFALTELGNSFRTPVDQVPLRDVVVISYSGVRGAIAFALAMRLGDLSSPGREDQFITTTLAVIWFTLFIQGNTVKPLLTLLRTERAKERMTTADVTTRVLSAALEPFTLVVAAIAGRERSFIKEWSLYVDRWIKKILIRGYSDQPTLATALLQMQESKTLMRKMEVEEGPDPVATCPNCACQFMTMAREPRIMQAGRQVVAETFGGGRG